jgi:phage terminase large subunit-like protein
VSLIFTADEPERLRGKQHMKLWGDEYAAWRYKEAWDQASLGLRLGKNPQAIITTTPKPTKELRALIEAPTTIITRGSTYDNRQNLAVAFLSQIVARYEGTRLGRQELNAEILDDNPGALWKRQQIEDLRLSVAPAMIRIVVAIDPAATSNANSDETGITVQGLDAHGDGHLLADLSMRGTPQEWARVAVNAYHDWNADRIIGETNNGGEMVETVIRMVDKAVPFKAVHASRGKITRAEPISALYEQGRCHHVGSFPLLEDQMCDYDPKTSKYSPDRMDALVWGFTELMTKHIATPTIRSL